MICNYCRYQLPDDSEYCQYCGRKLNVEVQTDRSIELDECNPDFSKATRSKVSNSQKKTSLSRGTAIYKDKIDKIANILILFFLVPIAAIVVCLNEKYIYSKTDVFYFISIALCAISGIILFIGKKNVLLANVSVLLSIFSIIPLLLDPWNDAENNMIISALLITAIITIAIISVIEIYYIVLLIFDSYHSSANYKIRCYENLEKIMTLKEKNIISENEFDDLKKQLLDKIRKKLIFIITVSVTVKKLIT